LHLQGIELWPSSLKSYTKLMFLKLCFLEVFIITVPIQQKFVNSCDIIMRDHIKVRGALDMYIPPFPGSASESILN
jgi:hypothetical protein